MGGAVAIAEPEYGAGIRKGKARGWDRWRVIGRNMLWNASRASALGPPAAAARPSRSATAPIPRRDADGGGLARTRDPAPGPRGSSVSLRRLRAGRRALSFLLSAGRRAR